VHAPVDVAQVVSGAVRAELRELGREPAVGRAMEAHEEALHHLPGDELDATELRERARIEEIGSCAGGGAPSYFVHERRRKLPVPVARLNGEVVSPPEVPRGPACPRRWTRTALRVRGTGGGGWHACCETGGRRAPPREP